MRDELIARFEGNEEGGFTEEYVQEEFGASRIEMFEKVKKNGIVFTFNNEYNGTSKKEYKKWINNGFATESYPLALVG